MGRWASEVVSVLWCSLLVLDYEWCVYLPTPITALANQLSGFDGSIMGSINAIPEFQSYYGLSEKGASATGLVFSIFMIGQMTGALFTWTCDWGGRRMCMFGGCLGVCVGTVVTSVATNRKLKHPSIKLSS